MKALLIDNYDSFIYNLKYELEALGVTVTVCRNDIDYKQMRSLSEKNEVVILSPGPGRPTDAGNCLKLIRDEAVSKPILGICLGHQVIIEAFDGRISNAKTIMHGKTSLIKLTQNGLFAKNYKKELSVARYHSLSAEKVPEVLSIDAVTTDGEVMAISHKHKMIFGLQFHPESIMTLDGEKLLKSFVEIASNFEQYKLGEINAATT